jgi:phytoene desaturase
MSSKHVVVVGSGPGGLASAMLLAASGVQVTVLEKRDHVGGRTSTFEQEGYKFDYGPTFFLYPRVLREIFAAAGYSLDREVPMVRLDPQYRLIFGQGGELLATGNETRMRETIAKLCPSDADSFKRFMLDNRTKLQKLIPFFESPFEGWRDLLRPEVLKLLPIVAPWNSLDAELNRYFTDERIRLGFSFQSKYLGMSPFSCPGLFSILSFLEYEYGVFHPIGGCGAITRAMARICEEMGVKVLCGESVEEVTFTGRKATGVRTSRRSLSADAVVMNAEFAEAARRMIPARLRSRWSDKAIESKDFSCSTFMLYLGIEGRYEDVSHHTIYLTEDYRKNLQEIETDHSLSSNPSFYVQNASVSDDTLAPIGHSALYVLAPVTHESKNVDWHRESAVFRDRVLDGMGRIGMGDIRARIRTERILTPANWKTDFGLHKGATFSMAHSLRQLLHLRPHNRFEETEGLYLAGGGTHPGSGLPVIFESARISAKLLLQDLGVPSAWEFERSAFDQADLQGGDLVKP